nr:ribonuclease H-like domain, reverse transcriptase, RNA-dependent DNA polymerase [Tanacetum cinerariifolium]
MARLQFCNYHNIVAILEKGEHNVDFDPIVDFVEASPLRRNLKLQYEEGISSLANEELFENLTLIGYNISLNQKFTFQKGQFSHQWKYLIHTIMQCLSPKSTWFNEFSSTIATALVCLATSRTYNFSKMIFDGLVKNVNNKSFALPLVSDEPASPLRDVNQGEACPTDSGFEHQGLLPLLLLRAVAAEGIMQQSLNELTAFCTSLQRQHSELISKFKVQELEINRLKARVKLLEDRKGLVGERSGDDAPIKGRNLDEREAAADPLIPLVSKDDITMMAGCKTCWSFSSLRHCGVISYSWVIPLFDSQELPSCLTKRS